MFHCTVLFSTSNSIVVHFSWTEINYVDIMQNEALLDSFINPERILCVIIYYRPQTKFAKVMFSQVFVCTRGGSLSGGSLSRWSLSGGGVLGGLSRLGGLCPGWGVSVQGGSLSRIPPYSNERVVRILLECIIIMKTVYKLLLF